MERPQTGRRRSTYQRQWHYRPPCPVETSPFVALPPRLARMWPWVRDRWFSLAENVVLVGVATLCWMFFSPALEEARTLSPGWIAQIWARNLILMVLVAGGLHLYFYRWRKQGDRLKFDPRDLGQGRAFTFADQVHDNMVWTLASGVTVWTLYEVAMFWALANGWAPLLDARAHPVWFALILFLTPVWISFHFYWIHRALHWPPLYRLAHALHHRNVNVGPWSGFSMHPVEHVMFLSNVLIHLVVPAHPIHIMFALQHQALTGASSHTGFENLMVGEKPRFALGTFHHQLHHRYFDCNYGNLEVPWDKLFGSFHDGTEDSHEAFKARRRELISRGAQTG